MSVGWLDGGEVKTVGAALVCQNFRDHVCDALKEGSFDALVLQGTLTYILRMTVENEISERSDAFAKFTCS